MSTKNPPQVKLIRNTWAFRGATAIYYVTLVLRAVYPIFVWSFYLTHRGPARWDRLIEPAATLAVDRRALAVMLAGPC